MRSRAETLRADAPGRRPALARQSGSERSSAATRRGRTQASPVEAIRREGALLCPSDCKRGLQADALSRIDGLATLAPKRFLGGPGTATEILRQFNLLVACAASTDDGAVRHAPQDAHHRRARWPASFLRSRGCISVASQMSFARRIAPRSPLSYALRMCSAHLMVPRPRAAATIRHIDVN